MAKARDTDPVPFEELTQRARRRLLARSVLKVAVLSAALLLLYFVLPLSDFRAGGTLIIFIIESAAFVAVLTWRIRAIVVADYPQLRAIEALGLALMLLIVVFATVYVSMSHADPANFSEPLSRSASLYFTITVLSTVGFGDIVPVTDAGRLVASGQMLIDLAILGVILRVVVRAARSGLQRQHNDRGAAGD